MCVLTWNDEAGLTESQTAAVIRTSPFCGVLFALGRDENLSRSFLADIKALSLHSKTLQQCHQGHLNGRRGYTESCSKLPRTTPSLGCHGNIVTTLEVCDILVLVKADGCVSEAMNIVIIVISYSSFLSFFPSILHSPFLPFSLPPVPLPVSLERLNTDSQLVPPPFPSLLSSLELLPPSHPTLRLTDRKQEVTLPRSR